MVMTIVAYTWQIYSFFNHEQKQIWQSSSYPSTPNFDLMRDYYLYPEVGKYFYVAKMTFHECLKRLNGGGWW